MRQGVEPELIHRMLPDEVRSEVKLADLETALADSLYSGYIEKQKLATERVNHHDSLKVPESFHFSRVSGLSNEMVERLERAQPRNFGQVRKIQGLTPAAVSTVLVHLTAQKPQGLSKN
jgi:tRNA U34 5-carboxymethylaminomethyl modifying enzyme MnmG/GidA